jgi:hypothetical protein
MDKRLFPLCVVGVLSVASLPARATCPFVSPPISCGQSIQGEIDSLGDCRSDGFNPPRYYDEYEFFGVAGTQVTLTVNSTASLFDPAVYFFGPSGGYFSDEAASFEDEASLAVELPETGTWHVWATYSGSTLTPVSRKAYAVSLACAQAPPPPACTRDATTACLLGGRFQVRILYANAATNGAARVMGFGAARAESDQSAFYFFTSAANFEMGVKMVDACSLNSKFWFFVSGLTNQQWIAQVLDTETGAIRYYENLLGTLSQTTADTSAFPCP